MRRKDLNDGRMDSMKEKPDILVVDDDPNISRLEQLYLEKENFEVRVADRGDTALEEFRRLPPDLILLDVMLPGMDGYQVLKTVRKSGNIPVIMVTARGETFDKVLCLELGADDYITKPFTMEILLARMQALLRRTGMKEEQEDHVVSIGNIRFDRKRQVLIINGEEHKMTSREAALLDMLYEKHNDVLYRSYALKKI
jgi:DNA-binding response OmpR family regulator